MAQESFKNTDKLKRTLWLIDVEDTDRNVGIQKMDSVLKESAPEGLRWKISIYANETHMSVRLNSLLEVNSALSHCDNLEQLYLSGNKNLSDLPNMSFCEKLEIIDVVDTKIDEVPGWIQMLDSLFYFKYTGKK
jgi:hypothetical protein